MLLSAVEKTQTGGRRAPGRTRCLHGAPRERLPVEVTFEGRSEGVHRSTSGLAGGTGSPPHQHRDLLCQLPGVRKVTMRDPFLQFGLSAPHPALQRSAEPLGALEVGGEEVANPTARVGCPTGSGVWQGGASRCDVGPRELEFHVGGGRGRRGKGGFCP